MKRTGLDSRYRTCQTATDHGASRRRGAAGRVTAASVAAAVAFLLSDRAASITGQTLVIDAGMTA